MKKILLISNSNLSSDPRLINQAIAFCEHYEVHTLGLGSLSNCNKSFAISKILRQYSFHYNYPIIFRKILTLLIFTNNVIVACSKKKKFKEQNDYRYWKHINLKRLKKLKKTDYDLIWANDIDVLPLAVAICSEKSKLIFDAHEYFLEEQGNEEWFKINHSYRKYLFETNLYRINKMVTVSDSIAELFHQQFQIMPAVILNAKPYQERIPTLNKTEGIHLVHHGIALPYRNLEKIIDLFEKLDNTFILHFYLKESPFGIQKLLKQKADGNNRIIFHKPVAMSLLVKEISQYDIGIFLLDNNSQSHQNALPNKLFECIQARLMLIYSSLTEIKKIIELYNIGIVADQNDIDALAFRMNTITKKEILNYKENVEKAALELCAENEWEKMRNIAKELLS